MAELRYGECPVCGKRITIIKAGKLRVHGNGWLMNCDKLSKVRQVGTRP